MRWNLPAILSNIVDIFRGLTNKKKPKYNGIRSKCGILVLFFMIVGIKLEWLAFGFFKTDLVFVTKGEYLIIFFTTSLFFSFLVVTFCASALAWRQGSSQKAIRTFTVNCLLDKPARSKDLMF